MFKIIALVGAIAGGATYGLYAHTDLFGDACGGGGCSLATQPACCEGKEPATPSCCENPSAGSSDDCCEGKAVTASASAPKPDTCCATKVSATKTSACCAVPCSECTSVGMEAKAAVAGPAGALMGTAKK